MPISINGIANPASYAPTLLEPANATYQDLATTPTFAWTYNPGTTGNSQTAWALRRKISGATTYQWWNITTSAWQSTQIFNTGSGQNYTFPSGAWADGYTYNWSVATQDQSGIGAYSADNIVTAQAGPTVSAPAPSGLIATGQPTISWTAAFPTSAQQTSYRVAIYNATQYLASGFSPGFSAALFDTGVVAASTTFSVSLLGSSTYLADNVSYRAYVQITETGGQTSNWIYATFTTVYAVLPTPSISALQQIDSATGAPFIELGISIPPLNELSSDDASFEGGVGTWASASNCSIAQSPVEYLSGNYSLSMTAVAANDMISQTGAYPVTAGQTYTIMMSVRAASTSRQVGVAFRFNNAFEVSNSITDSSSNWSQVVYSFTAPSGATSVQVNAIVFGAAASEVHYVDEVALYLGGGSTNIVPDTTDLHTWQNGTVAPFSIASSPLGGNQFQVLGTGNAAGYAYTVSQIFSVTPGETYAVSGYIDATYCSGGAPNMQIFTPAITTSYFSISQSLGAKGTVSGTWTCPAGVTEVVVIFDTANTTIASGQNLIFAQPQLTLGSTAQPYVQGANWTVGGAYSPGTAVIQVQKSTDQVTWSDVRNASSVPVPGSSVGIADYECTPQQLTYYRAFVNDPLLGIQSDGSDLSSSTLATATWWIIPPLNPALATSMTVMSYSMTQMEQMAAHQLPGLSFPQVVASAMGGKDGSIQVETVNTAQWNALEAAINSQQVMWLINPFGEGIYARIGLAPGGMNSGNGSTSKQAHVLPSPASVPYRQITLTYNQVAKP